MGDDYVRQNLDDNLFQSIVTFGEAVEEEVQVVISKILIVVSINAIYSFTDESTYFAEQRSQTQADVSSLADHGLVSLNSWDYERVQDVGE